MPYGRYPGARARVQGTDLVTGVKGQRNDYVSQQSGQRRHDFLSGAPDVGTPLTLGGLDYIGVTFARFLRSFQAAVDDIPPTATAGNNYQTTSVFNGSRISDFQAKIRLTNKSNADPAVLTVYRFALSFFDVHIWNGLVASECPLSFLTSPTNEGEVDWKTLLTGALNQNAHENRKFLQHYAHRVGDVTLGLEGTGKETAELVFRGIPAKCRRSQTGMFYGYAFANDSDKNEGRSVGMDYSAEIHFNETPSDNRLPWLS